MRFLIRSGRHDCVCNTIHRNGLPPRPKFRAVDISSGGENKERVSSPFFRDPSKTAGKFKKSTQPATRTIFNPRCRRRRVITFRYYVLDPRKSAIREKNTYLFVNPITLSPPRFENLKHGLENRDDAPWPCHRRGTCTCTLPSCAHDPRREVL